MDSDLKNSLKRQFSGFLKTAVLIEKSWDGIDFFQLNKTLCKDWKLPDDFLMPQNIRLGQRMEFFMEAALKATNYDILAKNLQIIADKKTVGELDFIVENKAENTVFHLEMVYKFYLFDPEIQGHWAQQYIGANRRDSLFLKLKKLKEKQLPLLYAPQTKEYLDAFQLKKENIAQKVCFKGQLFLPFEQKNQLNENINPDAVTGYWLTQKKLNALQVLAEKILIPAKNDWVTTPPLYDPRWKSYEEQLPALNSIVVDRRSTLIYILTIAGELRSFFLVWW